jgi:hypothetical protein
MRFKTFYEGHILTLQQSMMLLGYKPGDYVDKEDFRTRWRAAWKRIVADQNDDEQLKQLNDAKGDIEKYVGQNLPSNGNTYTPPPPPKEESVPDYDWHDNTLHSLSRYAFGKWFHKKATELLDLFNSKLKLEKKHNKIGEAVGNMKRAYAEWINNHRTEPVVLKPDNFDEILEALDYTMLPNYSDLKENAFITKSLQNAKQIFLNQFWSAFLKTFKV